MELRELRSALGCFPTGVIVVTASCEGAEHGMTANSFTSVSLEPPLVLVCIDNNARMSRLIERGMQFGLSILASDQENISRHFSGRPQPGCVAQFVWYRGVPFIAGAAALFLCRATDSRVAGDHSVCIAEVEHFERTSRPPLVFSGGSYTSLEMRR